MSKTSFMASDEFSEEFKQQFATVADDYVDGTINYEQFEQQLGYLQSKENAKMLLENYNSELKDDIISIDNEIQNRTNNKTYRTATNITIGAMLASTASLIGSGAAYQIYDFKTIFKDKIASSDNRKENENTL